MPLRYTGLFYLFPLFILAACAVPSARVVEKSRYQVEVIGPQEQALEALQQAPNQFVLPFVDDEHAWERAQLFFKTYTQGADKQEFDYPASGVTLISKQGNRDKYFYEVERMTRPQGYSYFVRCRKNPSVGQGVYDFSKRNAQNLARFIREGQLELTLLDR